MVKTRISARQAAQRKLTQENVVDKKKKRKFTRCERWIQSQKKEKPKCTVDDLESEETDDEMQNIRLEKASQEAKNDDTITKVYLQCEWQRCSVVFETYKDLQTHIWNHLQVTRASTEIFQCEWDLCDYEHTDDTVFKRHVLYHTYMTNLKTIGEQLLHKRPLPPCMNDSRRRNLIPDFESKYVCMWRECTYTFELAQDYYDHARFHCVYEIECHKQGNRNTMVQCKWSSCKKQFNKRLKMTDHMRTHTGERFVACSNCGSTFNSYVKFYDHFRRQATGNYKCNECLHSFSTEELLNNHMYGHVNRLKCTMCDMTCPSAAALTQHFRYRHLKEKPFKCTECSYSAVTKYDLNKHIARMHNPEQSTYFCEEFECEYSCLSMNLLRKHNRNVHGEGPNIYCCHCCNSRYQNGTSLSKHLIKRHGFQLPSGHRRFTYRMGMDGIFRVQTTRMESLEVSEQIMAPPTAGDTTNDKNIAYALSEFKETTNGLSIAVIEKEVSETSESKPSTDESSHDEHSVNVVKNVIETIDSYTFMESLNLKHLQPSEKIETIRTSDIHIRPRDNDEGLKNIENFSVIAKYKRKKSIELTVDVVDDDGNVVRSEIQNIPELKRIKNA